MESSDATRILRIAQDKSATLLAMHRMLLTYLPPVLPVGTQGSEFCPCETELCSNATGTVFIFSSMATENGYPFRQFGRQLRGQGVNIIYLKDFEQIWYQRGLLETTPNRAETGSFLHREFGHLPRPWTFVGGSAGGHAAIYFGITLNAETVVAFSPQTFITPQTFQNFRLASSALTDFDYDDTTNDLQPLVQRGGRGRRYIHYGAQNKRDVGHAQRLSGAPGVHLVPHPTDTHLIAAMLRDQNKLTDAIMLRQNKFSLK